MTPFLELVLVLAILISAAKLAGALSVRLRQPAVLGELLAGVLLGPSGSICWAGRYCTTHISRSKSFTSQS